MAIRKPYRIIKLPCGARSTTEEPSILRPSPGNVLSLVICGAAVTCFTFIIYKETLDRLRSDQLKVSILAAVVEADDIFLVKCFDL